MAGQTTYEWRVLGCCRPPCLSRMIEGLDSGSKDVLVKPEATTHQEPQKFWRRGKLGTWERSHVGLNVLGCVKTGNEGKHFSLQSSALRGFYC